MNALIAVVSPLMLLGAQHAVQKTTWHARFTVPVHQNSSAFTYYPLMAKYFDVKQERRPSKN
jgi:hypothetical protein